MEWALERDIDEIVTRLGESTHRFAGKTVLLCGGAGFLGRYFLRVFDLLNRRILKPPCTLVALDNLITSGKARPSELAGDHVRFVEHNIVEPLTLDIRIDYLVQAAGIASPYYYRKYPLETLEAATVGTRRMLDLAQQQDVKGFLFFSSSEIYGDPDPAHVPTPESYRGNISCIGPRACYDESKRLGETLCNIFHYRYGVPTTIVRPFNVYGPGMQQTDYRVLPNFMSRALSDKPLQVYGSGKQTRTFCYVTDAVVGFLKVLLEGTPGQAYNIGNPEPEVSMMELALMLEKVTGRKLNVRRVEYPDSYPADEPQRRCPDIQKASLQLGYRPQVALEEGLLRFYTWSQEAYAQSSRHNGKSSTHRADRLGPLG